MAKQVLTALNMNKNEIQNPVIHVLATAPSSGSTGQLYYNSTDLCLYQYNGTSWVSVGTTYDLSAGTVSSNTAPITLTGADGTTDTIYIKGAGGATITQSSGTITISTADTTYTLSGALSGSTYVATLTPSSGSASTATIPAATSSSAGLMTGGYVSTLNTASANAADAISALIDGVYLSDVLDTYSEIDAIHYGTCSTAAATTAKTVSCVGFTLVTGAWIAVKFTVTNTASSPTLNVNGTGAKSIYYRESAITAGYLAANRTYFFVYNGTQYELIGDINTDTNTYVTQNAAITTNGAYPVILGNSTATTAVTNTVNKSSNLTYNPSTKALVTGGTVNGYTLAAASAKSVDTSISSTTSTNLPTSAAVASYVASQLTGAASFQGTVSTGTDISGLTAYSSGWYWLVDTAGTYVGQTCESGDMIFCVSDYSSAYSASDFTVIQSNIVGAITSITGTSPISASTSGGAATISHASSGVTAATYGTNSSTALTPAFGATFSVPGFAVNATGHITSASSHTVKIPNTVATSSSAGLMSASHAGAVDRVINYSIDTLKYGDTVLTAGQTEVSVNIGSDFVLVSYIARDASTNEEVVIDAKSYVSSNDYGYAVFSIASAYTNNINIRYLASDE